MSNGKKLTVTTYSSSQIKFHKVELYRSSLIYKTHIS